MQGRARHPCRAGAYCADDCAGLAHHWAAHGAQPFIFPFCPVVGGYAYFGIGSEVVPHVLDFSAGRYPEVLQGIRAGRIDELGMKSSRARP
jgi:hypothetical protein